MNYKQKWRRERNDKIPYYKEIMYKYLPAQTRIEFFRGRHVMVLGRGTCDGRVYKNGYGEFIIQIPQLKRKKHLFTFLHEVGHIIWGHFGSLGKGIPVWRQEKEADQFAKMICERENIPLTKTELYYINQYTKDMKNE